ncbi:hypothetical protein M5K25_004686 [Dendrobium thyrsiflorum]|uniref:Uncharacterized protein n=1 Tax=Dendrobium thyrsiflorum TaxID=117978 RepID=A0ABD0VGS8_DENTH
MSYIRRIEDFKIVQDDVQSSRMICSHRSIQSTDSSQCLGSLPSPGSGEKGGAVLCRKKNGSLPEEEWFSAITKEWMIQIVLDDVSLSQALAGGGQTQWRTFSGGPPPASSSTQRLLEPGLTGFWLTDVWDDVPCHMEAIQRLAWRILAVHSYGGHLNCAPLARPSHSIPSFRKRPAELSEHSYSFPQLPSLLQPLVRASSDEISPWSARSHTSGGPPIPASEGKLLATSSSSSPREKPIRWGFLQEKETVKLEMIKVLLVMRPVFINLRESVRLQQGGEALTKKSSFFLFHPYTVMAENPSSFLRQRTATLPFSPLLGDGREPSSFLRQRTATIFLFHHSLVMAENPSSFLRQRTATLFLLPAENRNTSFFTTPW